MRKKNNNRARGFLCALCVSAVYLPAFSGLPPPFLRFLCVNQLQLIFLTLYPCSSAFICGAFDLRKRGANLQARRATKNCANARNLPARSP
jgi:hypothetical protein